MGLHLADFMYKAAAYDRDRLALFIKIWLQILLNYFFANAAIILSYINDRLT
jgi:hypothetical protein